VSAAAKVREHKAAHPEMYCSVRGCLWRTGGRNGSPCRKHPAPAVSDRIAQALFRNCRAYTDGRKSFESFGTRNRRLWDMATAAGVSVAVTKAVTPPLMSAYPKWARETAMVAS